MGWARRVEAAWLFAHGTSAAFVGAKTCLESLLPAIAGGVVGATVALLAVDILGPEGPVDRQAFVRAAVATGAAVLGAVGLIGLAAGRGYVRLTNPHDRRLAHLAQAVPWELAIAALAFVAAQRLRSGGAFVTDEQMHLVRPSLALVAFPFLLFTGFGVLAARVARAGFGLLRRATGGASPALYVAVRRLAGGGALTVLLIGAAGLCLGMFLNAQIVSRSIDSTVRAKANAFVGSDVRIEVNYVSQPPPDFAFPITRVVQAGDGARLPDGGALDLLATDPDTLAAAAYWNPAFADASLEELAERLAAPTGDRLPVIVVAPADLQVDELVVGTDTLPVQIVGRAKAFPGLYSRKPLVVVDEDLLLERLDTPFNPLARHGAHLWVKGDPDAVLRALGRSGVPFYQVTTAEEVQDIPFVAAAIDTFLVVNALGTVAAALTFVGMLMYLQARQRSQIVSYALSTRMGMSHGQHRRALTLELGTMLGWGFAVGVILALVAARVTVPLLDPIRSIPPEPLMTTPVALIAGSALAVLGLAWFGAGLTNRRARSFDLGEVLRVSE